MGPKYHVGDRVRIPRGTGHVSGKISEYRGRLGGGGRRLYQIVAYTDPMVPELSTFERGEDEIETYREPDDPMAGLEPERVIKFLKNGGLAYLLATGGEDESNAWLCLDSLGGVTFTFLRELGRIGGKPVPSGAVDDLRIVAAKRDEVAELLMSFGLDRDQANAVIDAVGMTRPRKPARASRRA